MAKTTTGFDEHGSFTGAKVTRHQKKSEQRLIGWTPGPQTKWQKLVRKAVG